MSSRVGRSLVNSKTPCGSPSRPIRVTGSQPVASISRRYSAGVIGVTTVVHFERQRRVVSAEAIGAMRQALEKAGVEFTNGKRPGGEVEV
jgi:hypothetical protein